MLISRPAKRDLIIFHAGPVQTQNADMPDMMMTAGINAARYFDLQRADIKFTLFLLKMCCDLLGYRNRARCGQPAIIQPGAGNDI